MEHQVRAMTFGELKKIISDLENNRQVSENTKIFIDTGWDSVQELEPESIHVETVKEFKVEDELTKELYTGFSLAEKAEKMNASGVEETAIILRNLY
ncbi:hypothetical protein [Candidatus Enterococcus clewellii]|uniref:Uncharacterized protein n=1 Tax=Candidatus Enterococcus clewellii TaxID=1834193 RepID=A0A242K3Q9_9ENTE|nr:hypothetical protein [Enterococcus sp. 9E7_DIV0242]OTP12845.1 hypothetical protein A5888_003426 [Enterococcus sp. 9E7_DIV0242]